MMKRKLEIFFFTIKEILVYDYLPRHDEWEENSYFYILDLYLHRQLGESDLDFTWQPYVS